MKRISTCNVSIANSYWPKLAKINGENYVALPCPDQKQDVSFLVKRKKRYRCYGQMLP